MNSVNRPAIPWKRYWVAQDSLSRVELDAGFLKLPTELQKRYTRDKTPDLKHLADLKETPCLVLLGSSGLGKSHELRGISDDNTGNSGHRVCHIDLRGRSDATSISKALFSRLEFCNWHGGKHALTLVLDSLDECQRRVGEVGQLICDELRPLLGTRPILRLRLGCRSSEWNTEVNSALKELFPAPKDGPPVVQVFHLERLTREQVTAAARHRAVDADAFLSEIDRIGLAALAAHPITLDLLLDDRAAGRQLGRTRVEIYERGMLSLCTDQHPRPADASQNTTTPEQRLALAARNAAIGLLSDRYAFELSPEQASFASAATLSTDDLIGEPGGRTPIKATTRSLRETLFCGLFEGTSDQRATWRHRSYAEFLAARHFHANLSLDDLLGLFCDPTTSVPRLYPQLEEVAAWLAEMNASFFDQVADANAEVFLRCDPHLLQPAIRERLTTAYLRRIGQDDAEVPGWFIELPLDKLAHPNLSAHLRPIIFDSAQPWLLRRTALQIAADCCLGDLALDCVPLLFAVNTPSGLISVVGDLLRASASEEVCTALRAQLLAALSPPNDVIAWSVQVLWSDHLSGEELTRLLPSPSTWENDGSLRHVCYDDIPNRARVDQLPALLRWLRDQGDALNDYHNYWGGLAKQHIAIRGLRHLDNPAVLAEFITLFAAQTHNSGHLLPRGAEDRDDAVETPMRRLFCQTVIEDHPTLFPKPFIWFSHDNQLLRPTDLPWAVERLREASNPERRERWLSYAFIIFDGTIQSVAMIESITDLMPEASAILAQRTSWLLEEFGRPHWEKTRYHQLLETERLLAAEPPFATTIAQALAAFEGADLNAMPWLLHQLDRYTPNPVPGTPTPRGSRPNGWTVIDAELTRRIHAAYPRYLEQITDGRLLLTGDGQETGHTRHALECMLHAMVHEPAWFTNRPAAFWQAWQSPMLLLGQHGFDTRQSLHTSLILKLYETAPGSFAAALDKALLKMRKQFFDLRLVQSPPVIADAAVRKVLLEHAQSGETTRSLAHELWGLLLREPTPEAESWLVAATKADPPNLFAASVLLVHRSATHGVGVAEDMLCSDDYLRSVCLALPGSGFSVQHDWGLRLPPELTLRVWEAMERIVPPDSEATKSGNVTSEKGLYHLRNNLLNLFGANPSPERCAAWRVMQTRRPSDAGWIGQMLVRMRKQLRSSDWAKLSPRQARDYLDVESKPKPLASDGDLCGRVLKILAEFQRLLRDVPNPSAELWNTPAGPIQHWYPCIETDVSDRLQYHLNAALGPLGGRAERESETRRGHATVGDPTDLPDLVVSVPSEARPGVLLRVVIEVKCTWHKEAVISLRTQLAERYLRTFSCGIYCLLHFTCPTWDLPKDNRRTSGRARAKFSDLEREVKTLLDTLRLEQPERRIEALVIDARRTPPGGHTNTPVKSTTPKARLRKKSK